ncbi:hypothetical protein D3C78_1914650 [compost metagenome]
MLGALSLSGPLAQFTDASVEFMAPLLIEACQLGSLALGGRAQRDASAHAPKHL